MFNTKDSYSLSDIAAVTNGNRNDGFFGGNGAWWIIILFLFCFVGGYGNGYGGIFGGQGSTGSGITDGYILTSDFANIERKLDGVNNGLCEGVYTQAQLINGVNNNIATSTYSLKDAIQANAIAQMQDTNALSTQLANCCCENRSAVADLKYTMATDACAINTNLANTARDIIDNDNANYRAIDARLTAMEMSAKDEKIATQAQQITALQLAASQQAQNSYLIHALNPTPVPAYTVPNPYVSYAPGCGCCACV